MLKKSYISDFSENFCTDFTGTAQEVKALYRACKKHGNIIPVFTDFPRFNSQRQYTLTIEWRTCGDSLMTVSRA